MLMLPVANRLNSSGRGSRNGAAGSIDRAPWLPEIKSTQDLRDEIWISLPLHHEETRLSQSVKALSIFIIDADVVGKRVAADPHLRGRLEFTSCAADALLGCWRLSAHHGPAGRNQEQSWRIAAASEASPAMGLNVSPRTNVESMTLC